MSSDPHTSLVLLNDTLRRVITQVRTTQAPDATLTEAREALARVEALLAPHAHPGPYAQSSLVAEGMGETDLRGDPSDFFPYSPAIGALNPVAPPVEFRVENGEVVGRGRLGAPYNGPPGYVHGGMVALLLDELLGSVTVVNDCGGYTGTLTIKYLRPTPLDQELTLRAEVARVEGRKAWARGGIWAGDEKTAEAEGIFIQSPTQHAAAARDT